MNSVEATPSSDVSNNRMIPRLTHHLPSSLPHSRPISGREKECADYLLKGLSAKEIGKALGLSHRTIERHLLSLRKKLQCNKTSALIVKLIELGYGSLHSI